MRNGRLEHDTADIIGKKPRSPSRIRVLQHFRIAARPNSDPSQSSLLDDFLFSEDLTGNVPDCCRPAEEPVAPPALTSRPCRSRIEFDRLNSNLTLANSKSSRSFNIFILYYFVYGNYFTQVLYRGNFMQI